MGGNLAVRVITLIMFVVLLVVDGLNIYWYAGSDAVEGYISSDDGSHEITKRSGSRRRHTNAKRKVTVYDYTVSYDYDYETYETTIDTETRREVGDTYRLRVMRKDPSKVVKTGIAQIILFIVSTFMCLLCFFFTFLPGKTRTYVHVSYTP